MRIRVFAPDDNEITKEFDIEAIKKSLPPRLWVEDRIYYWNFFDGDIDFKPLRGTDPIIKGSIKCTLPKGLIFNHKRRQKRADKRGIRKCPICDKEFIPKRSDAMICPMMACKKEAQKRGLCFRKREAKN